MNLDAMGMSIAILKCLAFQTYRPYDTLRLGGNTHFFGIVKMEYRSKNCVLFENVFFVSHVINRRRAPIAKSPIFFVFVSPLSIYM